MVIDSITLISTWASRSLLSPMSLVFWVGDPSSSEARTAASRSSSSPRRRRSSPRSSTWARSVTAGSGSCSSSRAEIWRRLSPVRKCQCPVEPRHLIRPVAPVPARRAIGLHQALCPPNAEAPARTARWPARAGPRSTSTTACGPARRPCSERRTSHSVRINPGTASATDRCARLWLARQATLAPADGRACGPGAR